MRNTIEKTLSIDIAVWETLKIGRKNDAKKTVKLGFPQEQWKEFGVTDKR